MGTTDERWKACKELGRQSHIIARQPELVEEIVECCKNAINNDESGVVRYHAVRALGKLGPVIVKRSPDEAEELCEICLGALAKDPYDRVRRGACESVLDLTVVRSKRPDIATKMREVLCKVMSNDKYDIVRCDAATTLGRLGAPKSKGARAMLDVLKNAPQDDSSELVRVCAPFSLCKLSMRPPEKLDEDMERIKEFMITQEHWSYWMQRECVIKAIGELGPLLASGSRPKVLDKVLTILVSATSDMVWDVRVTACKILAGFAPTSNSEGSPKSPKSAAAAWADTFFAEELRRRAVPPLLKCLNDENQDVRQAAKEALSIRR